MSDGFLLRCVGLIDDSLVEMSIKQFKRIKVERMKHFFTSIGIAACVLVMVAVPIAFRLDLIGYHATDIYRQGICVKIDDNRTISDVCEKPLLSDRLDLSNAYYSDIELWYDESGSTSDFDTWYSLITSGKFDEYEFVLYSLFEGDIDKWKVKTVFTEDSTQSIDINGITVLTAPHPISIDYPYYDYALFEYDGIIYDLRVQSNSKSTLLNLLNEIIPNSDKE